MTGFSTNIEETTLENRNYREVLFTAPHSQLVVMTLRPGEEVGLERHDTGDQFFRVEAGEGEAIIDGEKHRLTDGTAVIVPSGAEHNIVNTSKTQSLRFYTIYSPPQHAAGTLHRTKRDADAEEAHAHA
jgi:mannose-6-phosphate isomerase-like protein (cupin superfamily)